ncbi:glutamate [NMDA] receptor subunit 1 [Eurytemora carolleeae]|uniref:glutamate [NMDA] receptor subunit 1 n=1 Tax=Eurytemora carolleeae TaxID=1294199 RepID=UPI000C776F9D|nr:glutamate [NMDA] receptor subunit 1 [Eurytemora carolleeae]|eukprot:XP_023342632.1 glutamate [NMDA] receptor subunit 1-like [Eurytemora affinis]
MNTKCFVIITSQTIGVEDVWISRYKPKLIFIIHQGDIINTITGKSRPYLEIRKNSPYVKYRNIHGEIFDGVWSKHRSDLLFKGVADSSAVDSFQNKKIRIKHNNYMPRFFMLTETRCNEDTFEGLYMQLFLDKLNLTAEFIFAFTNWGRLNVETGLWDGVVGGVVYDEADVGITYMSYNAQRMQYVSYTTPVGEFKPVWFSKYPGRSSPAWNIIEVFDYYGWLAILVSTIAAILVFLMVVQAAPILGFKQPDNIIVSLMPISLINAEGMPDWFLLQKEQRRVWSGSVLLMVWAIGSLFLTMAFSSNLRAILLNPTYEAPLDTSKQIVERGPIVILKESSWIFPFLKSSPFPWQVKILDNFRYSNPKLEPWDQSLRNVMEGTEINFGTEDLVLHFVKKNATLAQSNKPSFYFSKEVLNSHYTGWVIQKASKWEEKLNSHILHCHQAGLHEKILRSLGKLIYDQSISDTEKMRMEHVAIAFFILAVGLVLAASGRIHLSKKKNFEKLLN